VLFEKQQFQDDCVSNIIKILDDTDILNNDFSNLSKAIQKLNSDNKQTQFITCQKNKIDILMETGTGKTFTYLKTIFELNKTYGRTKFIIVVPRDAIKAGVIQNITLTKEYFFNDYQTHLNIIEYPKDGISKIEHDFLNNNSKITILIMTNSAFNKRYNLINRLPENGNLFINGTIWENIAKQNPIVIIDEPHLLKGTETQTSFDKLENSLFIRFGATYPNDKSLSDVLKLSNVAYALDSISSFNHSLVKKIRVYTIFDKSDTDGYILSSIEAKKKQFKLTYFKDSESYAKDIQLSQDIGAKTGLNAFKGVYATKITADTVYLSNQSELNIKTGFELSETEIEHMIKATIEKHFETEQALFDKDIKTLSLFFIPNVSDFRGNDPTIKNIFESVYKEIRNRIYEATDNQKYKAYLESDFDKADGILSVHQGYFSGDKGTSDDKITAGINEILHDKEKLLSFESPLRFIFSVWALQEGWDNPNIFNICKLSNTAKEISRRQQVGRGLRICVNQAGKRQTFTHLNENEHDFYAINTLNMFVSHYELDFIKNIQTEIEQASFCIVGNVIDLTMLKDKGLTERETSRLLNLLEDENIISYVEANDNYTINSSIYDFLTHHSDKISFIDKARLEIIKDTFKENKTAVENGNKEKIKVKIRSDKLAEFKELWETINRKSKLVYRDITQHELIDSIAKTFNSEQIPPTQIKILEQSYNSQNNCIENHSATTVSNNVRFFSSNDYNEFINSFIRDATLKLSFQFMMCLLPKLDIQKIKNNPKRAKTRLKEIITQSIHGSVTQKIDYAFESEIQITALQNKDTHDYLESIDYSVLGNRISQRQAPEHLLYDKIVFDSKIEEDIQSQDPEKIDNQKITVFAKLPKISIPTPYKKYNPDFAYLIDRPNNKKLFLIVEAKGYDSFSEIPDDEQKKIDYAKIFFKKLQQEMPHVQIAFKTRINTTDLSSLLSEIGGV
jgi:type III restriction enzyme